MKLSKSKVNTYLKCPLEFKFQYIDEVEVPQNKYMALGSDVHLIAEKFAKKFGDNLDNIDIDNELLKIVHEEDIGYDLTPHVDNLSSFLKKCLLKMILNSIHRKNIYLMKKIVFLESVILF